MPFYYGFQLIARAFDFRDVYYVVEAVGKGARALLALQQYAIMNRFNKACQFLEFSVIGKHLLDVVILNVLLFEQILV